MNEEPANIKVYLGWVFSDKKPSKKNNLSLEIKYKEYRVLKRYFLPAKYGPIKHPIPLIEIKIPFALLNFSDDVIWTKYLVVRQFIPAFISKIT